MEEALDLWLNLLAREEMESSALPLLIESDVPDPPDSFLENILISDFICVPGLTESRHRTGLLYA